MNYSHLSWLLLFIWIVHGISGKAKRLVKLSWGNGLKQTSFLDDSKTTIIVTLYSPQRVDFALKVIKVYQSKDFQSVILDIIVVWNNVFFTVPRALSSQRDLIVLTGRENSLNNRWILPIPYIRTASIIMHDDDMFADFEVFSCLLNTWKQNPNRLISHFARHAENVGLPTLAYKTGQLESTKVKYSLAIRMIMVATKFLYLYNSSMTPDMLDYVTNNIGQCSRSDCYA